MENEEEEVKRLERLIAEDNVYEVSNILNSIERLRFNSFRSSYKSQQTNFKQNRTAYSKLPLLHFAVQENRQKVVEYLLSQDFVENTVCNQYGENIYYVICRIRGAEELFSIIERKVPHHLLLDNSKVFIIACEKNNVFIVKRVHEILETLQLDFTQINYDAMYYGPCNYKQ